MSGSVISLHRIVELHVPVAWHEAVAVAQAVAACAETGERALGSDNCVLSAEGGLEVSGATETAWANPALGILQLLLEPTRAPAELLALIKKANGMSNAELADHLRFFMRPDASAVIQGLAARALQLDRDAAAQNAIEKLRAGAKAAVDFKGKKRDTAAKRRLPRRAAVVVGVAAGLASLGAVAVAVTSRGASASAKSLEAVSGSANQAVQDLTTKVDSLVDSGLKSLGLGSTETTPATSAPAAVVPASPRKSVRRMLPPTSVVAVASPTTDTLVAVASPIGESNPVNEAGEGSDVVDDHVYTSNDEEVRPPALVRPQLPTPTAGRRVNEATHLEVHVNAGGTVEKVRLYPEGSTVNDRMLVSAAKAWNFRPALKEGQAVRYTLLVPLTH